MSQVAKKAWGRMQMGQNKPLWYDIVTNLYPPMSFAAPKHVKEALKKGRVPKPLAIVYPEDKTRQELLRKYAREALRPICLDERMGSGGLERVVERQRELIERGVHADEARALATEELTSKEEERALEERVARAELGDALPGSKLIEQLTMQSS